MEHLTFLAHDKIHDEIISKIKELVNHKHVLLMARGNAAIKAAVSAVGGTILIPEEGGWLEYLKIRKHETVKCDDAAISLKHLDEKLESNKKAKKYSALLYQNPGGYFAEQPVEEIYRICKKNGCLVIMDASGSIGTRVCNGRYADIIVCSFGKWKLVEAGVGGFVSCNDSRLFAGIYSSHLFQQSLFKNRDLSKIKKALNDLPERIVFLKNRIKKIKEDLGNFEIIHKESLGFVVVIVFSVEEEKKRIENYCSKNNLSWTECPRYIRLNRPAISIEVKQL